MWSGSEILAAESDFDRWLEVVNLLSLQRVEPFLSDIAFPEEVPISTVREFARICAVKMVALLEGSSSEWLEEIRKSIGLELTELGRSIGDPGVQKMVSWIDDVFPRVHMLRAQARLWTSVLTRTMCVDEVVHDGGPFPSKEKSVSILAVFRQVLCPGLALMGRIDTADEMPKNEWDEFVYRQSPVGCSPMDSLGDAICRAQFFRAWREVRMSIDDREADLLTAWVRQRAARLSVPPDLIERPEIKGEGGDRSRRG